MQGYSTQESRLGARKQKGDWAVWPFGVTTLERAKTCNAPICQSATDQDNPFAPRRPERVLLTGTRSAESIMASGRVKRRIKGRTYCGSEQQQCIRSTKLLPNMEPSTHGAKPTLLGRLCERLDGVNAGLN